jgi:hypothetical protein
MSNPKTFASLSSTLLARKGGAAPAMRSQLNVSRTENVAKSLDDLGFNDLGEGPQDAAIVAMPANASPFNRPAQPRRSALSHGRSAAFTLRLDAQRHLQLRMACTLANRSAQQLVTDALDKMISNLPDVTELVAQAAKRR